MENLTGENKEVNQDLNNAPEAFSRQSIYGKWITAILAHPLHFITIVFILSRALCYALGIYFDTSFFSWGEQGLDIWLLKNKLWESIWYMHGQPPLFNLFNALVLNVFPEKSAAYVFQFCWLLLGWAHIIIFYKVLDELQIHRKIALLISLYLLLSPAVIFYENLYYYTQIELFILTLSVLLLIRFIKFNRFAHVCGFFASLAILILTRSMFHWAWLLVAVVFLLMFLPKQRKTILLASLFPVLFSGSWYVKNYLLFGKFTSSTWLGVSLANVAQPTTGIAQTERWKSVEYYKGHLKPDNRYANVEVLHTPYRRDSLENLNHLQYIQVADLFLKESVKQIKYDPLSYLSNVVKSHILFFGPAANYAGLSNNRETIKQYVTLYDLSFANAIYKRFTGKVLYHPSSYIVVAYLLIICLSIQLCVLWLRGESTEKKRKVLTMLFLLYNIAYIDFTGNFFEYSENVRFRFITIPSVLILLAMLADNYLPIIKRYYYSKKSKKLSAQQ